MIIILVEYSSLADCSFGALNMLFHSFLACQFSAEESALSLMVVSLNVTWYLSLADFRILFLECLEV
jgi:hypothetical protein